MGLTEVDPSPVEDTPAEYREKSYFPDQERQDGETEEIRGIRRMNTLGLRLGDHGMAWWRTYSYSLMSIPTNFAHVLILRNSPAHTKILLIHIHSLRRPAHNKRLHHTSRDPLSHRIEPLSPAHATILPVRPHRTPPRRSSPRRTRNFRNSTTAMETETGTSTLRCRDTDR
jgi:hypothetical protein